jgi:hypothetical protein
VRDEKIVSQLRFTLIKKDARWRMIRQSVGGLAKRSCALYSVERDRTQNRDTLLLIALAPGIFIWRLHLGTLSKDRDNSGL